MSHALTIRLLGSFSFAWCGREVPLPVGKTRDLAAVLALAAGRAQGRGTVATALWGECDEAGARKRLRMALWRLKRALRAVGGDADRVLSIRQHLRLRTGEDVWIDVAELTRHLDDGRLPSLRAAVELYCGDLLEDCFDDWCEAPRRELRTRFLRALRALMDQALAAGDLAAAIEWGGRLLQHDPLLEDVHRELMSCFNALGNRGAALRQFEICRRTLASELQVEPMSQTLEVYREICGGGAVVASPPPRPRLVSGHGDQIAAEVVRCARSWTLSVSS